MKTIRLAAACVFAACCLFSCNQKSKDKKIPVELAELPAASDSDSILADDVLGINEFCKYFDQSVFQTFTALPGIVSVIKAAKGLKITVDPAVLEKEDGSPVDGTIDVGVIELTTTSDLFKSNAATVCDGRLLASGGSYFIEMKCNGHRLRVKKGKSLRVDFPVLNTSEMELFYGERNINNEMNWKRAGVALKAKEEESLFNFNYNDYANYITEENYVPVGKLTLFRSLNEEVFYYNKRMTLDELVDTINRFSKKVFLDTVYTWPRSLDTLPKGTWIDTAYLLRKFGPPKQYYLKTYKSLQDEKDRMARRQALKDSLFAAWKAQSLAGQLQQYYQPSGITALGWINCDRFYKYKEQTEVELELPVTLSNSKIQFFMIFKSFNGLLNLNMDADGSEKNKLTDLPVGEPVILIGFSKANGKFFHCREEFTIQKNQTVQTIFQNIQEESVKAMFGKNVKI